MEEAESIQADNNIAEQAEANQADDHNAQASSVKPKKKSNKSSRQLKELKKFERLKKLSKLKKGSTSGPNPDRTAETFLRNIYRTQLDLTGLADTKANMMISVNGLILSILAASGSFLVNSDRHLLIPISALLVSSFLALVFALMAARPRACKKKKSTIEDFNEDKANILFFMQFTDLSPEEYLTVMRDVIKDRDRLHKHMALHSYGMGNVLVNKFKYLTHSYSIFGLGLGISILMFIIAFTVSATNLPAVASLSTATGPAMEKPWGPIDFSHMEQVYYPSAVHQLPNGSFIVAEDEKEQPLDLVDLHIDADMETTPLLTREIFRDNGPNQHFRSLNDLEGLDVDRQGFVYAITSHSRDSSGDSKTSREKLVRFKIADQTIIEPMAITDLKKSLVTAHPLLREAADVEDVKEDGGLNIESLSFTPDYSKLLVGFRGPLLDSKAIVVSIENPAELFDDDVAARVSPNIITLDLKGEGIRDMKYIPRLSGYLIVSGPLEDVDTQFTLWLWDGIPQSAPRQVNVAGLQKGLWQTEGITPAVVDGKERLLLVSDDGNIKKNRGARYLLVEYERLRIEQ